VLREANTIMRMKRPMVEMEVELKTLTGTHITPLTQNLIPSSNNNNNGNSNGNNNNMNNLTEEDNEGQKSFLNSEITSIQTEFSKNFMKTINDVKTEIIEFLDRTIKDIDDNNNNNNNK
jgi:hypothetical protein